MNYSLFSDTIYIKKIHPFEIKAKRELNKVLRRVRKRRGGRSEKNREFLMKTFYFRKQPRYFQRCFSRDGVFIINYIFSTTPNRYRRTHNHKVMFKDNIDIEYRFNKNGHIC